ESCPTFNEDFTVSKLGEKENTLAFFPCGERWKGVKYGDGIEHAVKVAASSLYEAAALGRRRFPQCDWRPEALLPVGDVGGVGPADDAQAEGGGAGEVVESRRRQANGCSGQTETSEQARGVDCFGQTVRRFVTLERLPQESDRHLRLNGKQTLWRMANTRKL